MIISSNIPDLLYSWLCKDFEGISKEAQRLSYDMFSLVTQLLNFGTIQNEVLIVKIFLHDSYSFLTSLIIHSRIYRVFYSHKTVVLT